MVPDSLNTIVEQTIEQQATRMINLAKQANQIQSKFINYYDSLGRIIQIAEDEKYVNTNTWFYYNAKGQIDSIISKSIDTGFNHQAIEKHIWKYNKKGDIDSMLKIKNAKDTTYIVFVLDENNLPAEERWIRKNKVTETYFYYYNPKQQLTDIVRFNTRVKKLLPDFLFEYNDDNTLKSITQVPVSSSNYLTWEYFYDAQGRKIKELCKNKLKQAIGKVTYQYQP